MKLSPIKQKPIKHLLKTVFLIYSEHWFKMEKQLHDIDRQVTDG